MKDNKYKIIALTLILLCLCAVPAYAFDLLMMYTSKITNLGSYVGGYSYTKTNDYCEIVEVESYLLQDGVVVDSDFDDSDIYAQGDVGINNPSGTQNWHIMGIHYAEKAEETREGQSDDYGQS